jgi:hypothetical protein
MQGATLIGIGRNRRFRESGRWMLDAGAFLQALEYGADCTAVVMASQVLRHWRSAIDRGSARIICTMGDDVMLWLQGFVKQSTKTPPADLQVVHEIDAQAERWRMEVVNYHQKGPCSPDAYNQTSCRSPA